MSSPLLDRDPWRVDALWELVWDSLLTNISIQKDIKTVKLAEYNGDSYTDTLMRNPNLFRYMTHITKEKQ